MSVGFISSVIHIIKLSQMSTEFPNEQSYFVESLDDEGISDYVVAENYEEIKAEPVDGSRHLDSSPS